MGGDLFGVGLAVLLLAANAFFVGAEFALISARRDRLEALAEQGKKRAVTVMRAGEHLSLMLAGAQLGITICSILLGRVGEPAVAHLLEKPFALIGVPDAVLHEERGRAREHVALEPVERDDLIARRQARRVRTRFVEDAAVRDAERAAPAAEVDAEHAAFSFSMTSGASSRSQISACTGARSIPVITRCTIRPSIVARTSAMSASGSQGAIVPAAIPSRIRLAMARR